MISPFDIRKRLRSSAEFLLLALVLAIASAFRFYNLRTVPDWHVDESDFIAVARNFNLFSSTQLFWAAIAPSTSILRLPLFSAIVSFAFKLNGADIATIRSVTALCGIGAVFFVYLTVRAAVGFWPAIISALTLAVWPEPLYFSRIGFSYNLLALLISAFIFFAWRFYTSKRPSLLFVTSIIAGLAIATDYVGVALIPILVLLAFLGNIRRWWLYVLPVGIPPLLLVSPILVMHPQAVLDHLNFIFVAGTHPERPLLHKISIFLLVYGNLLRVESLVLFGIAGLMFIPNRILRRLLGATLFSFISILNLTKCLSEHYMIPLYPLLTPGIGVAFCLLYKYFSRTLATTIDWIKETLLPTTKDYLITTFILLAAKSTCLILFIICPFIFLFYTSRTLVDPESRKVNFPFKLMSGLFPECYQPPSDVEQVVNFLASVRKPNDVTLAPPNIAWLLTGNTTVPFEMQYCTIWAKDKSSSIPFAFECSMEHLTYALTERYTRKVVNKETLKKLEEWPTVFSIGDISIHRNPNAS